MKRTIIIMLIVLIGALSSCTMAGNDSGDLNTMDSSTVTDDPSNPEEPKKTNTVDLTRSNMTFGDTTYSLQPVYDDVGLIEGDKWNTTYYNDLFYYGVYEDPDKDLKVYLVMKGETGTQSYDDYDGNSETEIILHDIDSDNVWTNNTENITITVDTWTEDTIKGSFEGAVYTDHSNGDDKVHDIEGNFEVYLTDPVESTIRDEMHNALMDVQHYR